VPIKVMLVGLGPIGAAVLRQVAARRSLKPVAAVDVDPGLAGRDAGLAAGLGRKLRFPVHATVSAAVEAARPDVAVLCTTSSLEMALPVFEAVLKHKIPIVSTTEELAYPVRSHAAAARRIDALARRARVAVLGTGINPGFAMDALPIALTAVCARVDAIAVDRVQDARLRRVPFQRKIGAGLSPDEFATGVREGRIRHVGFGESITMIGDALGWKIDRITDQVTPKLAIERVEGGAIVVEPGQAAGLVQEGTGFVRGQPVVHLHMEAWLGAPESYDRVRITGTPPLEMTIAGGLPGDAATAAIVINAIPPVIRAAPGLRTMRDMPLPSYGDR
jgi:4-hydroxy-tetrahydrodipicolinate reductase